MDRVIIEGLEVEAVIGVYDWEREIQQRLRIDLDMAFDCHAAGVSDQLADALDYQAVATAVTELVAASQCGLIESVAEQVAAMLLRKYLTHQVRVQVRKPGAIASAASVGVCIERTRHA